MSYDPPPPPPSSYLPPPSGGGFGGDGGDALRGATIQQAAERFFKKYAVFAGRASRSEFWYWALISFVVGVILNLIGDGAHALRFLSYLWGLATICPDLALGARRLHDTGRSGWWQLLGIIPCVGWIILIVWFATPPKPAGAKYNQV